jgi:hypothetical protein
MQTKTEAQDLNIRLYEESLEIIRNTLPSIMQNIENKTGGTAELTRILRLQAGLRKTLRKSIDRQKHQKHQRDQSRLGSNRPGRNCPA